MSDMIDDFAAMREASRQKRAANRDRGQLRLAEAGIPFKTHNSGVHLLVGDPIKADYWPGTGRWVMRGGNKGFGVRALIEAMIRQTPGKEGER